MIFIEYQLDFLAEDFTTWTLLVKASQLPAYTSLLRSIQASAKLFKSDNTSDISQLHSKENV